ncbi:TerB family tellurite resistance protein [Methylobacterium sp. BTF04]|uniref:tellurite resistance TerB family protein n=1 Tax=Methylobacterium sp. BTF04 TaxID=2708300 RepID=UPI0013D2D2BC|nr:TerB family tellurite resistance protein [Methylobacterium sp. BTF04]NEU11691.1 TerB family tellurite resistance protein [Methylobacterium sp. BTF04]
MSLITRLRAYAADAFGIAGQPDVAEEADERLAAIALLVHVARADGVLAPVETERLARLVEGRFAQTRVEAEALIARAAAFDAQTRDMAVLVEMMGHEPDAEARRRLLAMAWSVANADGVIHEFEEALVWRLGRLLGFDDAAIGQAREGVGDGRGLTAPSAQ